MKKAKKIIIFLFVITILMLPNQQVFASSLQSGQDDVTLDQIKVDSDISKTEVFKKSKYYASDSGWNVYSSDYYYNQLNSSEKQFYDNLNAMCLNYITSTTAGLTKTVSGSQETMTTFLNYSGMSYNEAYNIALIFLFSNPQYYFLNDTVYYNSTAGTNYMSLGIYPDYVDGTSRNTATSSLKSKIDSWVSQVKSESGDYNKAKEAHDIVVSNVAYNDNTYDQSIISFLNSGTTVCTGYSKMYELLCDAADLNTLCVTSPTHAWNKIQINGTWYNVDCTWDDTDPGFTYNYFAKSDKTIQSGNSYHTIESYWTTYTSVPSCDVDYSSSSNTSQTTEGTSGITTYQGVDYSSVYNYSYYISKYPDIKAAFGNDQYKAIEHFVNCGMKEARQASSSFNVTIYKNNYKDLRQNFGDDLSKYYLHFMNNGKAEGRNAIASNGALDGITVYNGIDYAPVYNYSYYVAKYPDIAAAFSNDDVKTLEHFVKNGMAEGRVATENFDVHAYRANNLDLRQAFGNNLPLYYMHYIQTGKNENRVTTGNTDITNGITTYQGVNYAAVYNYSYYIQHNPDIAAAFPNDDEAVLQHFVQFGMSEGRDASADFNLATYKGNNADLRSAFGDNNVDYYLHYIHSGKAEGRIAK